MKPNIAEICQRLIDEVSDTGMEINFSNEGVITIYWNSVNRLDCSAGDAAKCIKLVKALEALGMRDC
jgi:hypothetical protein